jgi:uncharacterized protein (TIGR02421 family)
MDAAEAAGLLARRLRAYFPGGSVRVVVRRGLSADAAVEGDCLKLRAGGRFSPRELRLLEVHEGWAHLGTTHNGRRQAPCSFLGRAFPACTPTQEGLAVFAELQAGVSYPARLRKLACRVDAVALADAGADFLEVFRFLAGKGHSPHESYQQAARVFRGSLPQAAGPFAKDLAYGVGLWRVARFLCGGADDLAVGLLWCGKTALADVEPLTRLAGAGLVRPPDRLPFSPHDGRRLAACLAET